EAARRVAAGSNPEIATASSPQIAVGSEPGETNSTIGRLKLARIERSEPVIEVLELEDQQPEPDAKEDKEDKEDSEAARTLHARLRGLNFAEQIKLAGTGDINERILLERMYGKNVWEPLLRNPRLTAPEVARISRMGALPRVILEIIVSNVGWLQIPDVRRALLSNPRLGPDQITKILRLMPKPELRLVPTQTTLPFGVRDVARRLLRGEG
ncbi:MAG: hypothetical protein H0T79_20060, partial [Deltaproteobacteria bacterium]|nr:hypothetical protein [Deltaproteobacteria bacterium]